MVFKLTFATKSNSGASFGQLKCRAGFDKREWTVYVHGVVREDFIEVVEGVAK